MFVANVSRLTKVFIAEESSVVATADIEPLVLADAPTISTSSTST